MIRIGSRRFFLVCLFVVLFSAGLALSVRSILTFSPVPDENGVFHVYPGDDIQTTLDEAASDPLHRRIQVHAGIYRPNRHGQAFIWLNKIHDGITLEAVGDVVLTAVNTEVADERDEGYPCIVNHVVYFGDGITRKTVFRGFKITGANGYVTTSDVPLIQPFIGRPELQPAMFFYSDGGGIKIFGRSYPSIENVEVYENYVSPCGAGVSVEHRGHTQNSVLLKDCIFRNNQCTVTGSAVDLLNGSSVEIENCLFVENLSNTHMDERASHVGKWKPNHGSGALTVFPKSRVVVRNCTFTGNRNGVDDSSEGNRYENSIFWKNSAAGGWPTGKRYELDLADGKGVRNCHLNGDVIDLNDTVDEHENRFGCPDPQFDNFYVPRAEGFQDAGYRPGAG